MISRYKRPMETPKGNIQLEGNQSKNQLKTLWWQESWSTQRIQLLARGKLGPKLKRCAIPVLFSPVHHAPIS
jgi:hypothetical protein